MFGSLFGKRESVRPKIGLALGGGAARGLAHVGVLKVFEQEGIRVDAIAGTSFGAFIGALHAAGVPASVVEEVALGIDWKRLVQFLDPVIPRSGLIDGRRIERFMAELLPVRTFEELQIPLAVTAADIDNGDTICIRKGDLTQALRAAVSFPGLFTPVRFNDRYLFDGGVCAPIPVEQVREMGVDKVIAVSVEPKVDKRSHEEFVEPKEVAEPGDDLPEWLPPSIERLVSLLRGQEENGKNGHPNGKNGNRNGGFRQDEGPPGLMRVFTQALVIMENELAELYLAQNPPDLLIKPDLGDLTLLEFGRADEAIAAGEAAARKMLEPLRNLLKVR